MLGTRTLRDRSTSHDPDVAQTTAAAKTDAKTKTQSKTTPGQWVEPSLAQQPSYKDHKGVSYYPGVSEHMQALGEAPLARVKARVKPDGARKSLLLGKGGGAAGGVEAQETPEGTPVPLQTAAQAAKETAENSRMVLVVDDENDADYAPTGAGSKKKERAARPRSAKLPPAAAAAATTGSVKPKITLTHAALNKNRVYDARKMLAVVDQAKMRANAAGKPDLAAAVEEIYQDSLKNARLTELLESILLQTANKTQLAEFHAYVRAAKRRIRDAKESKGSQRRQPDAAANGVAQSSPLLPVRTPSTKVTPVESENSALPSTERLAAQPAKAKISLKAGKSPSQRLHPRQSGSMSLSPSNNRKRAGSVDSDSSLTDLTSNPDDDDEEEDLTAAGTATMAHNSTTNGVTAKDHAAERGSLAAPKGNLKRSSAEADLQEEERERTLATKKQKMRESMVPVDEMYEESNVRGAATTASTSRLRSLRGKTGSASAATGLSITPNGLRRSARVGSPDPDSPLSDLSPMTSRETTPHVYRGPSKAFGKKAKTKQSPEKLRATAGGGMSGASGAGRDSPIGADDNNEELSENNDFCSACGGSGFLLCCDGCDRSFHFSCLDPPLSEDASELNEPWYCYICVAKRPVFDSPEKPPPGLFSALFSTLKKRNPSNFALPQDIREYFEGVATDKNGQFVEAVNTRTRNKVGYEEPPDLTRTKDSKGNTILCYSCGTASHGNRQIIQCDYCGENWHLDCLDPPLANPPARNLEGRKVHDWMCPLHADHELRRLDASLLNHRDAGRRRKVHIRKPRNAKVVETALRRGVRNNGIVEVVDDESEDSGSEFYEEESQDNKSVVLRLPVSGIKLDFIDKVKQTRVQHLRTEHAYRRAQVAAAAPKQLEQANFARRTFMEKQMALNLAQFANANKDLNLGSDQVENLVGTLIAEAPQQVVDEMMAAEEQERARSASSAIPPSPPASEQPDQLSAAQRKDLQMLQELIRRRLEGAKT